MIQTFDNILLLGRPAAGKSEFIDFLKKIPERARAQKFHIGSFEELDDFPWLWKFFQEDYIWEKAGYPRRYSFGGENPGLHQEGSVLFDFCMAKFNDVYEKKYLKNEGFYKTKTLFVEFSRGGPKGYQRAFQQLSPEILKRAVILFIDISYEESCRRNQARYEEKLQHSILAHKCHEETMEIYYKTHDWEKLTKGKPSGLLTIQNFKIPFVTVLNEPEWTDPAKLESRYQPALETLEKLSNANV